MWPLSNITAKANTSTRPMVSPRINTNQLLCQVVSCMSTVDRFDKYRPHSPTISKRNIHFFNDSSTPFDDVILVQANAEPRSNTRNKKLKPSVNKQPLSNKSCIKTHRGVTSSDPSKCAKKKKVLFDIIEVREHPRILGDNPSAKKGPPLSIGWYTPTDGRILLYSVDEYERRRNPERQKTVAILSPTERQRMLLQEAGVTPSEIFAARKEVSKIRKSRREHNVLVEYDETAVVFEQCICTVKRLLTTGSVSEWELSSLMEQSERWQRSQQQKYDKTRPSN
jgi:hypothetical protein